MDCGQFRAHSLRPDKCRNCFGDKSRHQQQQEQVESEKATGDNGKTQEDGNKDELLKRCEERLASCEAAKSELADKCQRLSAELDETRRNKVSGDGFGEQVTTTATDDTKRAMQELRERAERAETEREEAREELRNLEREMEEMHDNFKEEESEQFEQLKQELDLATKNCKILQIRLSKSERQYGQLEQVKTMLERQLEQWTSQQVDSSAGSGGNGSKQHASEGSMLFAQIDSDSVRLSTSEYDQLLRDLNDTIERERDLQEQIKYSQEEAQTKSDRLQAVEAENEVLLSKVNRLTLANSRLRSNPLRCSVEVAKSSGSIDGSTTDAASVQQSSESKQQPVGGSQFADLIEETEQLKLALDLAQSECQRLRLKCSESETCLRESEARALQLEQELARLSGGSPSRARTGGHEPLELECRQLRAKLVHAERQLKELSVEKESGRAGFASRAGAGAAGRRSQSMDQAAESDERELLRAQNAELEARLARLVEQGAAPHEATRMESDLLEKLKRQLETSESELARAKSRLVELDLECSRAQREHKRLLESLAPANRADLATDGQQPQLQMTPVSRVQRAVRLPSESRVDSLSRQELRKLLKELDDEAEQLIGQLQARDCLVRELKAKAAAASGSTCDGGEASDEELSHALEQERLVSRNLRFDLGKVEQARQELESKCRMMERERGAMQEELARMRQVNDELERQLELARESGQQAALGCKELQVVCDKLRAELQLARNGSAIGQTRARQSQGQTVGEVVAGAGDTSPELMARDLNELKVKNGFLMRQLEVARDDASRQMDDLRAAHDAQVRRAVEMAQLELRERHLAESQQLRDELQELKRRLAASQRQATRADEEAAGERDRLRSLERDWRRDKSQWQQRIEQAEAQLALERRSSEFKAKERDSLARDKERELIGIQDRYVQLERDYKRLQNKYQLLEENSEAKQKSLARELEAKKRELGELATSGQMREDEYYALSKRFNSERATLMEALDSIKRSYDEKLAEIKSLRELLSVRQDQYFKERSSAQEQIEHLESQLIKMGEHETQAKLMRQQLQSVERQLETVRRDAGQVREDRHRLRARCEELERKCQAYEKQELLAKTSTISGVFSSKSVSSSNRPQLGAQQAAVESASKQRQEEARKSECVMVEKLSSKINDQRHLINILKQQVDELQMEVRQLRLLQAGERSKWQSRVAQLTGKLNEAEERLMFELQALAGSSRETLEGASQRAGAKWAHERQMSLELIQQLQGQNEQLTRDLKKLAQSYDLLRLQSKQLESHNNKLSRRIIDYQQQLATGGGNRSDRAALESCMAERESLLSRHDQLVKLNQRLVKLMRSEAQPLVETVSKMVAALDVADTTTSSSASTKPNPDSPTHHSSTHRPLLTASGGGGVQLSPIGADLSEFAGQQAATTKQPSRLARFLGAKPANATAAGKEGTQDSAVESGSKQSVADVSPDAIGTKDGSKQKPVKTVVKRVRVKSAALGISATEKKQLRGHLDQLASALDDLGADLERLDKPPEVVRTVSEKVTAPSVPVQTRAFSANRTLANPPVHLEPRSLRSSSQTPHSLASSDPYAGTSDQPHPQQQQRVRWQLQPGDDSDLDSNKSFGSVEPTDLYRRFPMTSPVSHHYSQMAGGSSLTDYESESSLASFADDFHGAAAAASSRRGPFVSGTESDSCLTAASNAAALKLKGPTKKRSSGLRTRLTTTLRNISRSITGLASDSEAEADSTGAKGRLRKVEVAARDDSPAGSSKRRNKKGDGGEEQPMLEIRV